MSLIDQIRAHRLSPEGISDEEMQGFQNIKAVNQDNARQAAAPRTVKRPPQRSPIADAAASAGRPAPQAAGRGGLDSLPPEVVQQLMKAKAAQEAPSQRTDERDPKALIMKLIQMLTGGSEGERVEDPRAAMDALRTQAGQQGPSGMMGSPMAPEIAQRLAAGAGARPSALPPRPTGSQNFPSNTGHPMASQQMTPEMLQGMFGRK